MSIRISPLVLLVAPAAAFPQSAADLFEPQSMTVLGTHGRLEAAGDFNGDGVQDLISVWNSHPHLGDYVRITFMFRFGAQPAGWGAAFSGDGPVGSGQNSFYGGAWDTVAGDFDGDGIDEAVIFAGHALRVFEPDSQLRPDRTLHVDLAPHAVHSLCEALVTDFNGDGLDDLVLVNDTVIRLMRADVSSAGVLGFTETDVLPAYGGATRLAAMDVNGDATDEVIVLQDSATPTLWTLGIENGVFGSVGRVFPRATAGGERIDLAPGDLDGDGDLDAVLFGHDGRYQVVTNHDGALTLAPEQLGGPATRIVDLDGDGDLDGICCGGGGGAIENTAPSTFHISLNQGAGIFETAVPFPSIGAVEVVGALDYDDDGDLDVVAGRSVLFNRGITGAEYCDQPVNSTGEVGRITVTGSTSLSLGGPSITAHNLPAATPAILLASRGEYAGHQPAVSFWDGNLCLHSSSIARLSVAVSGAAGFADMGNVNDWTVIPGYLTGTGPNRAWSYQVWHRDVNATGTGAGVTEAVRVYILD